MSPQFCYCRHPKQRFFGKCDFCQGARKAPAPVLPNESTRPMPGDWVEIVANDDCLAEPGTIGVIDGCVGKYGDYYLVCFNPYTPFRDDDVVQTSGGPGYHILAKDLVDAKRHEVKTFWRWRWLPEADGGFKYQAKVRIWKWSRLASFLAQLDEILTGKRKAIHQYFQTPRDWWESIDKKAYLSDDGYSRLWLNDDDFPHLRVEIADESKQAVKDKAITGNVTAILGPLESLINEWVEDYLS